MKKKTASKDSLPFRNYLVIAFIEGSSVMVCELLGAKMIAPVYGTSLFVWSSVIGVTLAALAAGYFIGGFLADRFTGNSLLFTILAAGACLIGLMPVIAEYAMTATMSLGVRMGSLISALLFLLPPLVCMGMTSPVIIRLASGDVQHTGRTAGSVYAVSTVGGIVATFFLGFYAISKWGLTVPTYVTAGILGLLPAAYFLWTKRYLFFLLLLVLMAFPSVKHVFHKDVPSNSSMTVLYKSEGLLGQVLVVKYTEPVEDSIAGRIVLFVNRHPQTSAYTKTGYSLWPYAHCIATIASIQPVGSKALILGLGGGSVADEFLRLGFEVDGCELDDRIARMARSYFNLSSRCKIINDDGRHYVRSTDRKYDLIVFDVFTGETQPSHLLTVESLREVKRILSGKGLVIINNNGFLAGTRGLGSRSIIGTLISVGYDVKFTGTPGTEENRNLIIVASPGTVDMSGLKVERQNECCRAIAQVPIPLPLSSAGDIDLGDALTLVDDRPILDALNVYANETWRRDMWREYDHLFGGMNVF